MQPLFTKNTRTYNKSNTYGAIAHLLSKANPRRTLVDAVSTFENFTGELVGMVYVDYPAKLLGSEQEDKQSNLQDVKLLRMIIESEDKDELMSRIAEEKIRNIFYGNPLDFYLKDKAKLEFGDYFRVNYKAEIEQLQEILSRRNIIIHNGGRIDRKYLREVRNTEFKLNKMVSITPEYLRESVELLERLAGAAAALVLKNIYKQNAKSILGKSWDSFKVEKS
jgi:hypothetical protein